MRSRTRGSDTNSQALARLTASYDAERGDLDAACSSIRALATAAHRAAELRVASGELADALTRATTTVAGVLALIEPVPPARHRLPRRRLATRSVPADVAAWSAELVRLTQIGVWLRRTTVDDLGVHVPTVVRVRSRAARAPQIAGMVANPDLGAGKVQQPRIGVHLQGIVDGRGDPGAPTTATPLPTDASTAKAA